MCRYYIIHNSEKFYTTAIKYARINVFILKIGYQLTHTDTFDLFDVPKSMTNVYFITYSWYVKSTKGEHTSNKNN